VEVAKALGENGSDRLVDPRTRVRWFAVADVTISSDFVAVLMVSTTRYDSTGVRVAFDSLLPKVIKATATPIAGR